MASLEFLWQRAVAWDFLPAPQRGDCELAIEPGRRAFVKGGLGSFTFHSDVKIATALAERLQAFCNHGCGFVVPKIKVGRDEGRPGGVDGGVGGLLQHGKRLGIDTDLGAALEVDQSHFVELRADPQDEASEHLNGLFAPSSGGAESGPLVIEIDLALDSLHSQKIGDDSASHTSADGHAGHAVLRLVQKLLVGLDAAISEDAQEVLGEFVVFNGGLAVNHHADRALERLHKGRLESALWISPLPHDFDFVDFSCLLGKACEVGAQQSDHAHHCDLKEGLHR